MILSIFHLSRASLFFGALLVLTSAGTEASAQVEVGGTGKRTIEVDMSVIQGLGGGMSPAPTFSLPPTTALAPTPAPRPKVSASPVTPLPATATKPLPLPQVDTAAKRAFESEAKGQAELDAKKAAEAEAKRQAELDAMKAALKKPPVQTAAIPAIPSVPELDDVPAIIPQPMAPPITPPQEVQSPSGESASVQVATLPPSSANAVMASKDQTSVTFAEGATKLPNDAKPRLEGLSLAMKEDPAMKLQLLSYATGTEATASKARRLSLSRALEVRSYLMDLGIPSTRIEVRALGHKVKQAPFDRVDVIPVKR